MLFKLIILINFLALIKCENDLSDNTLNETSPKPNGTEGERNGKNADILGILNDAIGSAAAGAINAVSDQVVTGLIGNSIVRTGEYCGGSRGSVRYCDDLCHDRFRFPMRGYCRTGICVCECDQYECDRYCRRYWDDHYDDFDHYDDYPRRRYRDRGYCSQSRGCTCE